MTMKSGFVFFSVLLLQSACGTDKPGNEVSEHGQKGGSQEIVICSYGGAFQEAQRKAFFEPFEKESGIKVREAEWSGEYAKLKAMVTSGKPTWDLVDTAESSTVFRGTEEGLLERIDWSRLGRSRFYPEAVTDYSVGSDFFATVIAYNRASSPDGIPGSWKDFWDIKKYPGARSLRNDPRTTLEFALLADGVPPDKIYPLDVDRAFRSLDKIKHSVKVWWTAGNQPAQLLATREVAFASAFNGRIWAAATKDKKPLAVVWKGGALDLDSWIIPKGGGHYEAVMKFLEFATRPESQIRLTQFINYGPTVKSAYANLTPESRSVLPSSPENREGQFVFDGKWWAHHESEVLERWNTWLLR